MNWFSGILQIWFTDGNSVTYYDVSLNKAQDILDTLPKSGISYAMYTPCAINMTQSR